MKSPRALRARPPFPKGADPANPPLEKGGRGDLKKGGQRGFKGLRYRSNLKPLARQLRSNMTDAERALWQRLRNKQIEGIQFYRQKPIGEFIVDFHAPAVRLVIEVDGGQHFEAAAAARDVARDRALHELGLLVLRFDNRQVLAEMEGVLKLVHQAVCARVRNPPCPPFSKGGEV